MKFAPQSKVLKNDVISWRPPSGGALQNGPCLHVSLQAGDRIELGTCLTVPTGFPPPWESGRTIALCIAVSPAPLLSITASTCCVCLCVSGFSWKILIPLWQGCHVGDVSPAHHNDDSQGVSHSAQVVSTTAAIVSSA